ncbi:MAG: hypothetical protein ABR958_00810 [Dehalococcoidales bacterium]
MKKILLISLVLVTILFGACIVGKNPTNPNTLPPSPTPIEITAVQLYKEYKNNQTAADKKYKGKEFTVSGAVQEIGKDQSGTPYLLLAAGENMTNGIYCTFPDNYDTILARLNIGQNVGITGVGVGFKDGNVLLDSTH